MKDIRDFGAIGDGIALETKAIQAAIDSGGAVRIPAGTWRCGTIYLKSNGGLVLDPDARIIASHDRADYNDDSYPPQNRVFASERVTGAHLIIAVGQENVFIKGEGVIDGDSHYWVNDSHIGEDGSTLIPDPSRPAQMIFFCECRDVRVTDIKLKNGSFWHLFFHGCTDVTVSGVHIDGEKHQFTNDGIDIDSCRNVTVTNCVISVGDDALTLRAYNDPLENKQPCENITVSNCILASHGAYGIRIGVGSGIIRRAVLSNLVIHDSHIGIGFTSRFSPNGSSTKIENLVICDSVISADRAFEVRLSNSDGHPPLKDFGYIRDILMRGLRMHTRFECRILGYEGGEVEGVTLDGCELIVSGAGDPPEREIGRIWGQETGDAAIVVKKARDVRFKNSRIRFRKDAVSFRRSFDCDLESTLNVIDCELER